MFTPTLGLICFVFDYIIVAIIYNWKQYSIRKLWNVRFIIIAVSNTIIAFFSFPVILVIIYSIDWIFPLDKYFFNDLYAIPAPVPNFSMFSIAYLIAGSILLYFPNQYILRITSKWKCILITILLTVIPVIIFRMVYPFFYSEIYPEIIFVFYDMLISFVLLLGVIFGGLIFCEPSSSQRRDNYRAYAIGNLSLFFGLLTLNPERPKPLPIYALILGIFLLLAGILIIGVPLIKTLRRYKSNKSH